MSETPLPPPPMTASVQFTDQTPGPWAPLPPPSPAVTVSADLPRRAPGTVVIAVVLAAVAAAVCMPDTLSGIGVALTGTVVLAAMFVGSPRRPRPGEIVTAAGVVALLAVSGWRSAEWLTVFYTGLALVTTGVVVVGARTLREMCFAMVAPIMLSLRTSRWFGRAVGATYAGRRVENPAAVAGVALVTVALVVVFGALFAGADAMFAALLSFLTPDVDDPHISWSVVIALIAAAATASGCFLRHARPRLADRAPRPVGDTWIWAVPTGTVLALFVVFLGTQAGAMIGGRKYVQDTAGLTFAEYARSGFWQLFAITALTIVVVTVAWQRSDRATMRGAAVARGVLGALCVCALLVVASAVHRMVLYIDAYGATRLRVSVMAVELWLGAILLALIIAGAGVGTRHLARVVGTLTIGAALAFAIWDPDAQIARIGVDRYETSVAQNRPPRIDVEYLSDLSPDATAQLLRLPDDLRACILSDIASDVRRDRGWTEFSVGRAHARDLLDDEHLLSPATPGRCPSAAGGGR